MPIGRNLIITQTGADDRSTSIHQSRPFNIATQAFIPAGSTTTCSVEFTLDDLSNPDGSPNQNARRDGAR
jgi:hypothetical protein